MSCFKKNNPGDPCCEVDPPCTVFVDDFTTATVEDGREVRSGTWSIGSSELTTSSNNSLVIFDDEIPGSGVVPQTIDVRVRLRGGSATIIGLAYTDDDNYLFARLEYNGGLEIIRLYKKVAGTVTQIGSGVVFTGSGLPVQVRVRLCFNGITLVANRFGGTATVGAIVSDTFEGRKALVGTYNGTISVQTDFDAIAYGSLGTNEAWPTNIGDETEGCMKCSPSCAQCDASHPPPAEIQVTLGSGPTNDAYCACDEIPGVYALTSDSGCCWHYRGPAECSVPVPGCTPNPGMYGLSLRLCISNIGGGNYRWELLITFHSNVSCIDPVYDVNIIYRTDVEATDDACENPPATLTYVSGNFSGLCGGTMPSVALSV